MIKAYGVFSTPWMSSVAFIIRIRHGSFEEDLGVV